MSTRILIATCLGCLIATGGVRLARPDAPPGRRLSLSELQGHFGASPYIRSERNDDACDRINAGGGYLPGTFGCLEGHYCVLCETIMIGDQILQSGSVGVPVQNPDPWSCAGPRYTGYCYWYAPENRAICYLDGNTDGDCSGQIYLTTIQ